MRPIRNGFTLVELLVVILIVGILAAVGVAKFASTKDRAFLTTMKADLRNLATAQEAFLHDQGTYYGGPLPDAGLAFAPSTAVSLSLAGVTQSGWQATATHSQTTRVCAIFQGTASPVYPATKEGVPACD